VKLLVIVAYSTTMKFRYLYYFALVFLTLNSSANNGLNDQINPADVPSSVKNAFNRIYVDQDPEAWYSEMIKPKGEKKSKRYTATYQAEEKMYAVRFDERGLALGYKVSSTALLSNDLILEVASRRMGYNLTEAAMVYSYEEETYYYRLELVNRSRKEVLFTNLEGETITSDFLVTEFGD
jgi:hypothetical protein